MHEIEQLKQFDLSLLHLNKDTDSQKDYIYKTRDIFNNLHPRLVSNEDLSQQLQSILDLKQEIYDALMKNKSDTEDFLRIIYTIVCSIGAVWYVRRKKDYFSALKMIDHAIVISGAPVMYECLINVAEQIQMIINQISEHLVSRICKSSKKLSIKLDNENLVKSIDANSCSYQIIKDLLNQMELFVIKNYAQKWPIVENYNMEKLVGYIGLNRTVPVEIGTLYNRDDWEQKLMTISEFCDEFMLNQSQAIGYIAQHNLLRQIPKLRDIISHPDIACLSYQSITGEQRQIISSDDLIIHTWLGPCNTISPLHQDNFDNFYIQCIGQKFIRLYHPEERDYLYTSSDDRLQNTSQMGDILLLSQEEQEKHYKFKKAKFQEVILNSGDLLFIPQGYWHFVKSLSPSFSVSYWRK